MKTITKEGDEIFDELEKERIFEFNEDPVMQSALKKVLLYSVYYNGTLKKGELPQGMRNFMLSQAGNPDFSNEELGKRTRIILDAVSLIEMAYEKIAEYKRPEKEEEKPNPAI